MDTISLKPIFEFDPRYNNSFCLLRMTPNSLLIEFKTDLLTSLTRTATKQSRPRFDRMVSKYGTPLRRVKSGCFGLLLKKRT